jgi:hypothetical protein
VSIEDEVRRQLIRNIHKTTTTKNAYDDMVQEELVSASSKRWPCGVAEIGG